MNDNDIIDMYTDKEEDEHTVMAKSDFSNRRTVKIDEVHMAPNRKEPTLLQGGNNAEYALRTAVHRIVCNITKEEKRVSFARKPTVATFSSIDKSTMVTYDSGSDSNYTSEKDRQKLGLPILRISSKRVGVENGGGSSGKYVTRLPFPQISKKAAEEDTFDNFPTYLMSIGKTSDDGNVSIFTKE